MTDPHYFSPFLNGQFRRVAEWQKQFNHRSPKPILYHLLEEVKEELLGGDPYDIKEYADVFILWAGAVVTAGHSLEAAQEAVREKMDVNERRTWHPPDENGVIRHVKEKDTDGSTPAAH